MTPKFIEVQALLVGKKECIINLSQITYIYSIGENACIVFGEKDNQLKLAIDYDQLSALIKKALSS